MEDNNFTESEYQYLDDFACDYDDVNYDDYEEIDYDNYEGLDYENYDYRQQDSALDFMQFPEFQNDMPSFTPPSGGGPQFFPPGSSRPPFRPPVGGGPQFFPPGSVRPPFRPPVGLPWQSNIQRFRRCMNRISVVTLNNNSRFWFYPTDIRRQRLIGFRWRRNRWEPYSIELFRILRINCN